MKISEQAIEFLVGLITGDSKHSPYRSGPQLVNFFNSHGEHDLYGQGFPSRVEYVREKFRSINGEVRLKEIIEDAFSNIIDENESAAEDLAFQLTKRLARDGYKLKKDYFPGFARGNEYIHGPIYFTVLPLKDSVTEIPESLLSMPSLNRHMEKVISRLEGGDFDGTVSICYTVIEEFLKLSLEECGVDYNKNEGSIKKLYGSLAKAEGFDAKDAPNESLKPLLNGLSSLVGGFYEISNKAGDRHSAKFRVSRHHAKLVVGLTFSFCEFLLESKDHRSNRRK